MLLLWYLDSETGALIWYPPLKPWNSGSFLMIWWLGFWAFTAWPEFNPWSRNWDPTSQTPWPTNKQTNKSTRLNLILRKLDTNPDWGTFHNTSGLYSSQLSMARKAKKAMELFQMKGYGRDMKLKVMHNTLELGPGSEKSARKDIIVPLFTELTQDWGNRLLEGTNKTLCTPGPGRKEQGPEKRLTQTCLWVSRSLRWRRGLAVYCCRVEALSAAVHACKGSFEGGHHYLHYLHHSLVSRQTKRREHSPAHQQKIGLKIYWARPFYFFALITQEGFLISPCYSLELCIQMGVSFFFSFAFHVFSFFSYL